MVSILDTHTHVIAPDQVRYPQHVDPALLPQWVHEHPVDAPGLLAELDAAGVDGAVLVQARGAYGYDNSYVADARALAPRRFVNAAVIDMTGPDRADALRYWTGERAVLGLRLFNIPPAAPEWLDTPETAQFVRAAAAAGVRLSVCVLAADLPAIGRLLAACPQALIAIDHCGFPALAPGFSSPDAAALASLAVHDNVRLKVTTTLLHQAQGSGLDPQDLVEWLAERFGTHRLMWGSDYPQHHSESYREIVAYGRAACGRLSPSEQAQFLGGSAAQLWPELTS
jgi:predicted TIM-barrel fold metal-dependent hydrolase